MNKLVEIVLDKGILALLVVLANFLVQRRMKQLSDARENEVQQLALARQNEERERAALREQERRETVPRTQFGIDCRFLGPHADHYVAEVSLTVSNVSSYRREFRRIRIRLRTLNADQPMNYRSVTDKGGGDLEFPNKPVEYEMVPKSEEGNAEHYYYVEPGITQTFHFVTMVPSVARFVLVHVTCVGRGQVDEKRYDVEFTEQRLFELPSVNAAETE